jgi:hypothetical protein
MQKFINNWETTLTAQTLVADLTFTVSTATATLLNALGLSATNPIKLTLWDVDTDISEAAETDTEIVLITAADAGTGVLTVPTDGRAQEGTTAQQWEIGDKIAAFITEGTMQEIFDYLSTAREVLTADRTYYYRTDGSDSNDGLTNTSDGAFLTRQKACDVVGGLDSSIYDVTIEQGNNGTFAGCVVKTMMGAGKIIFVGDTTTPSNCVFSSQLSVEDCMSRVEFGGFKFTGTDSAGSAIYAVNNKKISMTGKCEIASGGAQQIYVQSGSAELGDDYTISAGSTHSHILAIIDSVVTTPNAHTITLTGTPGYSTSGGGFVYCDRTSLVSIVTGNTTFSGSATGKRYNVQSNGVIFTGGGGATYFPGNVAGTTATGGQYL